MLFISSFFGCIVIIIDNGEGFLFEEGDGIVVNGISRDIRLLIGIFIRKEKMFGRSIGSYDDIVWMC